MSNPRLTDIQFLDLQYALGMLEDVINGAPDDGIDDIRVLRNVMSFCNGVANELMLSKMGSKA